MSDEIKKEKLEKNDYLVVDKGPAKTQNYACVSLLGPDTERNRYKDRLIKIRGVFNTLNQATKHAHKLKKQFKSTAVDIFVVQVGYWTPCFPQSKDTDLSKALNELMYDTLAQQVQRKLEYEERKKSIIESKEDPAKDAPSSLQTPPAPRSKAAT